MALTNATPANADGATDTSPEVQSPINNEETNSQNPLQKIGAGVVKGGQAVGKGLSNAWNAVSGVFKSEPCDKKDIDNLIAKGENGDQIEKTKLDKTKSCVVSKCKKNYVPNDTKNGCIQSEGDCTEKAKAIDANATSGELKKGNCIITECGNGYHPSDDGQSCEQAELSEEDSKNKVSELKDNAQKMKDKEQSTANKLLGGAAIGATGIGGMNLMSGMAEQKADDAAEEDMKAYLATFVCDYGQGRNIKGGERNIDLPGGNELFDEVNEYKALAADLKVRKEALGKTPGIEAEVIYDISETGLYDNVGLGRQSGAYASVAKALMDENSEDAKAWAEQKQAAHDKKNQGLTMAAVGAIGGMVGNLAINSGEKNKNKVDKIISDYDKKKRVFTEIQREINKVDNTKTCSSVDPNTTGGNYPYCECPPNQYFKEDACTACDEGKVINDDKTGCKCPGNQTEDSTGNCIPPNSNCTLTGDFADTQNCTCTGRSTPNATNTACECDPPNYENGNKECVECPSDGQHEIDSATGMCVEKTEDQTSISLEFETDTFFESGKSTLTSGANSFFSQFQKSLNDELTKVNLEMADITDYYICVVGHTDRVPFKKTSPMTNKKLSEARAKTIEDVLKNKTEFKNISSSGKGAEECTSKKYPKRNDPQCRKVTIKVQSSSCSE